MAIRGITFSKQSVSSNDDSHIYNVLLNGRKGRTKGCKMTYGTDDIQISSGYFIAAGRLVQVSSAETVSTPIVSSGTTYCRLVFEIDLTKTNTGSEFAQGYFKILSSTVDYPAITQEDLENGGSVYQLPFATFTKTVSGIGSFVPELETIGNHHGTAVVYVSTTGNDASGDGSESFPYRTIQHAINSIPKNLSGKTITINVASGTYAEDVEIAGFYGDPLRFQLGTVAINSLAAYDSCVVMWGSGLTVAASGKTYGIHCHRGANLIIQSPTTINGSTNGLYVGYGSKFEGRETVTVNSCTFAVVSAFASHVSLAALAGSKNNNGVQAAGGIVAVGTIDSAMASTLYSTIVGGRVYTGAQSNVPEY